MSIGALTDEEIAAMRERTRRWEEDASEQGGSTTGLAITKRLLATITARDEEIAAIRRLLAIPDAKANYAWRAIKSEQRVAQLEAALRLIRDTPDCYGYDRAWLVDNARTALEAK